jgi:hypothetical protein
MGHFARECHSARNNGESWTIQREEHQDHVVPIVVARGVAQDQRTPTATRRPSVDTEVTAAIADAAALQNPKNVEAVRLRKKE